MNTRFYTSSSRPDYRIKIADRDITPGIKSVGCEISITDNRGFEADTLELTLGDEDGSTPMPPRGAEISIAIGWVGEDLIDKGTYIIDEVEHAGAPDKITLRARSADLRTGITNKRERSFSGKTLGEIATTIGAAYGLQVMVSAKVENAVIDHVDQANESDANLLTRLARDFDCIAAVKSGRLLVMPIGEAESVTGIPFPTAVIDRKSGDRHRFSMAERDAFTAVKAYFQDINAAAQGEVIWNGSDMAVKQVREKEKAKKKRAEYDSVVTYFAPKKNTKTYGKIVTRRGTQKVTTERGNIHTMTKPKSADGQKVIGTVYAKQKTAADAGRKALNALLDKQALRETAKPEEIDSMMPIDQPSTDSVKTLRHTYASKTNAERAVRAEWNRLQRGMANFSIELARGRADLFPELPAQVSGFKAEIDSADWIIARVRSTISDTGFTTSLELELAI